MFTYSCSLFWLYSNCYCTSDCVGTVTALLLLLLLLPIVTKNIGKNLHFENTPHGAVWRILAPLGIACNIQVTCPLVVLAVRDMAVKLLDLESTASNQRYLSVFLLMVVTPVACSMSSAFPAVCGFIGSFATIFSSILLPMLFYHTVYRGRIALSTTIIHTTILIITLTVTAVGMYANFHSMFV